MRAPGPWPVDDVAMDSNAKREEKREVERDMEKKSKEKQRKNSCSANRGDAVFWCGAVGEPASSVVYVFMCVLLLARPPLFE